MAEESSPILSASVQSCRDAFGSERCKIMENQGDYQWIVGLKFTEEISAQFAISRHSSELMDVFLKGQNATRELRESFNRAISSFRVPSDIGLCMESAENWWKTEVAVNFKTKPESSDKLKQTPKEKRKFKKNPEDSVAEELTVHGMKPAQDVISRILWDKKLPSENFIVGYIDRFIGIIEKPFTAFNWDHFSTVDPEASAIPRHRIQYFKYGDTIVWDRRNRSDLIFGSGIVQNQKDTIEDVIAEENEKLGFVQDDSDEDFGFEDVAEDESSDEDYQKFEHSLAESANAAEGFQDVPAGVRPNYYLNIPIRSETVLGRIQAVQDSIKEQFPHAVRKRMNPDTLHITLCLFTLEDGKSRIESVAKAIESESVELQRILSETTIPIKGLALFRASRVIFAKPDRNSIKELMWKLGNVFTRHGIRFFVPENIHLTIYRLHPLRREDMWQAIEEVCAVSRFSATETYPTLSLKPMSQEKISFIGRTGRVPEFLPTFGTLPSDGLGKQESSEVPSGERSRKELGFHVRDAWEFDSLEDVVYKASAIGGTAMAFFFQYPREWNGKTVKIPEDARGFHEACEKSGVSLKNVVPHGSYWLNPGSSDDVHLERTRDRMVEDVEKCHGLGIPFYNVHPGVMMGGDSVENFIQSVADTVNFVHQRTEKCNVILLLETSARQGNEVGGTFEELKGMMDLVSNKKRLGICLDTCHIFAAGYDIRIKAAYDKTMSEFHRIIGMDNLKAVHLNDSKVGLGGRQDRHEAIGKGHIGMNAFRYMMNDPRLDEIPMILETPRQKDDHLSELQLLRSFEGRLRPESPFHCESNRWNSAVRDYSQIT